MTALPDKADLTDVNVTEATYRAALDSLIDFLSEQLGDAGGGVVVIENVTGATAVPLTIKAHASQSGNLQEWVDSADAVLAAVDEAGVAAFAGLDVGALAIAASDGLATFTAPATGSVPVTIQGMVSQTADLLQFKDGSGTVVASVLADGTWTGGIDAAVLSAGQVLIGDSTIGSPNALLHILRTGTGNIVLVQDEAGDTSPFVITDAGLVGIGTTTPGSALHVVAALGQIANFQSSDDGSGSGPNVDNSRLSASPAVNDLLGKFRLRGRNSSSSTVVYAGISGKISDPTAASEDGLLGLESIAAGALAARWWVGLGLFADGQTDTGAGRVNAAGYDIAGTSLFALANTWTQPQTLRTTSSYGTVLTLEGTSADAGPILAAYANSATPAAADDLFYLQVAANSSGAVKRTVAELFAQYVDPTDGAEDSRWGLSTIVAGTKATRWWVGAGLYADGQSDPGAGKIAVTGITLSGTDLFASALAFTNTISITTSGALSPPLTLVNTNADANGVQTIKRKDSASPAVADYIFEDYYEGRDSGAALDTMGVFRLGMANVTAGAESAGFEWLTIQAGSLAVRARLQAGLAVGAGQSDPGAGFVGAQSGYKIGSTNIYDYVNSLTVETAPAVADKVLLYDASASAARGMTLENALKVLNLLTEDTTPDAAADFLLSYDSSAGTVKKVKINVVGTSVPDVRGKHMVPILAGGMWPKATGGAAPGWFTTATNGFTFPCYDFDSSAEESVEFLVPWPKSANESTITFRTRWAGGASGGVVWELTAVGIGDDDVLDVAPGGAQVSTDSVTATTDLMISPESNALTITNLAEGDLVAFRLTRKVANGSDTMAADARLIDLDLFITTDAGTDA